MSLVAKTLAVVAATINTGSWQIERRHHRHPRPDPPPLPWHSAVASWYAEHGGGACGLGPDVQSGYRFASLILACGTRVQFRYAGRTVTATMADHGPYVAGRTFDLNAALRGALGCPDLCYLRWRAAR